jgi:hypothetical protein
MNTKLSALWTRGLACFVANLALELVACGDESDSDVLAENSGSAVEVVSKIDDLPVCEDSNEGALAWIKGESTARVCVEGLWFAMAAADSSDLNCSTEELADNSGQKIICNGDSIGVDRTFLAIFSHSLKDETLEDGSTRTVLSLPAKLAPYKAAVLPLVKKDGLPEKAREIQHLLMPDMMVQYDEKDAIGRRYRRQDAIGTPYCITVDNDTLSDNSVTVRHRDTMQQERISVENLNQYLHEHIKPIKID